MPDGNADVVIVGAGVAGVLIAYKLAQAGVDVLVLEAGPRVNRREALETPGSPYPEVPYAPRPSVIALQEYYVQDGPELFKSNYERRAGSTTWHWLGTSLRHLPSDFEMRPRYGVAVDWSISYEDVKPWYAEAERALGVAGDSDEDLGSPREEPFPTAGTANLTLTLAALALWAADTIKEDLSPRAQLN